MKRLYFLIPDAGTARRIVHELLDSGVAPDGIHLLARHTLHIDELPHGAVSASASLLHAVERGAEAGGTVGAVAGLTAVALPGGLVLAGGAIVLLALAGAGVGALTAGLLGRRTHDPEVARLEEGLARNEVLMLVDAEPERMPNLEELVRGHHPDVRIAAVRPGA